MDKIIIAPVGKQTSTHTHTHKETEETIKRQVDVMKLGVGVSRITQGAKGSVTLSMNRKEDQETLRKELKNNLGKEYTVQVPQLKRPKIKIIGIEEELNKWKEDDILLKIGLQNKLEINRTDFGIKIIKVMQKSGKEGTTMIMEVDPLTHKGIVEKGKLLVGWKICKVYDFVSIVRCFKYYGLGHFAKDCRNETGCRKCAGNQKLYA